MPPAYKPTVRYQVRFQLHGGIGRPETTLRGSGAVGALAGAEQIYVLPASWNQAPWWGPAQIESLDIILDKVKRTYNIDENRVAVSGVSDGGTGAYYIGMRDTTPYASFLPLNGFIMILANPSLGIREQLFPNNLRNKPFFVVNGGRDQLYPTSIVDPYVRHLQNGVPLTYLRETVDRWNGFADAGADDDFGRGADAPLHRIDTPPFYAAAIVLVWHDSYGGLRINGKCQVVDMKGEPIPGLYAGCEASGGGNQHGLGRGLVHGYIAGTNVVNEPAW